MILGFAYQGAKSILLILIISMFLWQVTSDDYFGISAGTKGGMVKQATSGIFVADLTPTLNKDDPSKTYIKTEVLAGCTGAMTGEKVHQDCTDLGMIGTLDMIILTLLVISAVPKYGEAAGTLAASLLAIAALATLWKYWGKKDDRLKEARENTPLSSTDEECVDGMCITAEYGEAYWLTWTLLVLSLVLLGQSGYGIFAQFMC